MYLREKVVFLTAYYFEKWKSYYNVRTSIIYMPFFLKEKKLLDEGNRRNVYIIESECDGNGDFRDYVIFVVFFRMKKINFQKKYTGMTFNKIQL